MKIKEIIKPLEEQAPLNWQEDYDNSGLTLGNIDNECTGALICLDIFPSTIKQAIDKHCNLVISHHPCVFHSIKKLVYGSQINEILTLAIKNDIAIYSAHTCMDNSKFGVAYGLSKALLVDDFVAFDSSRFPEEENYLGGGALGKLSTPIKAKDYLTRIKANLGIGAIKYCGDIEKNIQTIGFCGGSGSFLIEKAIENNCDIYLTADIKYHDFLSYSDKIILADIGHFESEQFIKQRFFDIISKNIRNFAPLYISDQTNRVKFL